VNRFVAVVVIARRLLFFASSESEIVLEQNECQNISTIQEKISHGTDLVENQHKSALLLRITSSEEETMKMGTIDAR